MSPSERMWAILAFTVGVALIVISVVACKTPSQAGGGYAKGAAISCTTEAVRESWPVAYPEVMHCLTALIASPTACLDAVPTLAKVGIDVVACIARGVYKEAAMAEHDNPSDVVTNRKVERSRAWLQARGFQFEEP